MNYDNASSAETIAFYVLQILTRQPFDGCWVLGVTLTEQQLLFTCFRHPGVPPTNNQAERSLCPVVIMRRVIQGTRSDKGLENHSVLRSLFETARRQGKNHTASFSISSPKTPPRPKPPSTANPSTPPLPNPSSVADPFLSQRRRSCELNCYNWYASFSTHIFIKDGDPFQPLSNANLDTSDLFGLDRA